MLNFFSRCRLGDFSETRYSSFQSRPTHYTAVVPAWQVLPLISKLTLTFKMVAHRYPELIKATRTMPQRKQLEFQSQINLPPSAAFTVKCFNGMLANWYCCPSSSEWHIWQTLNQTARGLNTGAARRYLSQISSYHLPPYIRWEAGGVGEVQQTGSGYRKTYSGSSLA